jgi:hypothetical protein
MHPLETYLREVRAIRDSGAGVAETSYYPALSALLNAAGRDLRPPVRCIINLKNRGAGIPDGGLFTPDQLDRGADDRPQPGQLPSRGALEVKGAGKEVSQIVESEQVRKYLGTYGQVLVTNLRDWVLVVPDRAGNPKAAESYRLAPSEGAFWDATRSPHRAAQEHGDGFLGFLRLVMLRPAPLTDPEEVAWVLASYARDARNRSEQVDLPALGALRGALEEALGMEFHGARGEHFFRSTLVQTLFYGIFSAWVLWSRQGGAGRFDWRTAGWTLRVPAIRALFHQITDPDRLFRLGLVEPLDWAAEALNRVDRAAFFTRFQEEHAVQYFYEPFLEAFDPELRKELGVWYTPPEVVKYMVARVDTVLKEELGIADGLADPRVLVLDPCCGTGAYLVEVLEHIAAVLRERGEDALLAAELRRAATERVFGFEILPAPFVVAHLQLGLLLQGYGASGEDQPETRRVGVYLTNALTGWGPPPDEQKTLAFPELQAEHDAAEAVKRKDSILVVLGNPPYNGYPGMAIGEERDLVHAYRTAKRAPKPQGQGLNDLYVRFFRMAERRIVEMTGKGVVCFISNYSWLDGLSFTGMRERYLEAFDRIWIDSLNGDKYRTGKLTPEGEPDPSIFSTERNREGIQVGTAVSLLVRTEPHGDTRTIYHRNLWGRDKRRELLQSTDGGDAGTYEEIEPAPELGFPFSPALTGAGYLSWPPLPEVFPTSFPGVKTSRDEVVVDTDQDRLFRRVEQYFDPQATDEELRRIVPAALRSTPRFDADAVRAILVRRGMKRENFVRYCYRPFDIRWLYWEPESKLLDEKRSEYVPHVVAGNVWLSAGQRNRKADFYAPQVTTVLSDHHIVESNVSMFPLFLIPPQHPDSLFDTLGDTSPRPNMSERAAVYLEEIGATPEDLFHHVVAILHAPDYRAENAGALRQDWPRVPLPSERVRLEAAAALGRQLAVLLDPERPVSGVTTGALRTELRVVAVLAKVGGGQLDPDAGDLAVTAGWGHSGKGGATMPGRGKAVERSYNEEELAAIETGANALGLSPDQAFALLGETCYDVYLNDRAYWRCIPARVWEYTLGGYQVIKKWLSYREEPLLGRALKLDEVREVSQIARRIAAILLLERALNDSYAAVKANTWEWGGPEGAGRSREGAS